MQIVKRENYMKAKEKVKTNPKDAAMYKKINGMMFKLRPKEMKNGKN